MSVSSPESNIGRWLCLRHEDGTLFEEYAYLVTDFKGGYNSRVFYVRRWAGKGDTASVVERAATLREWRGIAQDRVLMPDGWLPNWWGTLKEGPSMVTARKEGRIGF